MSNLSIVSCSECHHQAPPEPPTLWSRFGVVGRQHAVDRHRRHADAPERLVGGARRPRRADIFVAALAERELRVRALHRGPAGDLGGHRLVELGDLRHLVARHVDGRALHARAVDVEIDDRVVAQVVPERVGVPGRARIAAVAVARPPGEAEAVAQLAVELLQHARKLQHAAVAGDVVGRAVEPRAVVRADQRRIRGSWPLSSRSADARCASPRTCRRSASRAPGRPSASRSPDRRRSWRSTRHARAECFWPDRIPACPRPA